MPSARFALALDSLAPEASSYEHGAPGVVASSVYANGRRVADISIAVAWNGRGRNSR